MREAGIKQGGADMINFEFLEKNLSSLKREFNSGVFEYVVIDDFCDEDKLEMLFKAIPDPVAANINKSRDYFFAKNKYEKSKFKDYGPLFLELYDDLTSMRFEKIIGEITGEAVFIDKEFHGGGLHQGGKGSYLNMHADFNYHPINKDWFRNLNILLYLNKDWKQEFGGQLRLKNKNTGSRASVDPIFNRCVVMFTRDYTLHGYDAIDFPDGQYRRSIAAYAYSMTDSAGAVRSTTWYPEGENIVKQVIGRCWPNLVRVKNRLFGSSTTKNK